VLLRHNNVVAEWHHLCAQALTRSRLQRTFNLLRSGRQRGGSTSRRRATSGTSGRRATSASRDSGGAEQGLSSTFASQIPTLRTTEARILTRFWPSTRRRRRTSTSTPAWLGAVPSFSVDVLRGTEASAATKKLASRLSAKWKRTYSEVCGFVRSRLSITLVRTTSMCLRGSRDPTARANHAPWDTGVGLALY
jgi:hypothetical protein